MNKLPPEFKAKWLAALRSGKYQQTRFWLHRPNGFCCLGVACDLADSEQWYPSEATDDNDNPVKVYETRSQSKELPARGDLPDEVFEVLFQSSMDLDNSVMGHIANLNDDEEWSFAMIADWIEEHL